MSHYLMKILGDIQETVNELNAMEISNESALGLKSLLESARWRFEDVLVGAWLRGSTTPSPLSQHIAEVTP